jgi:2-(1,2-epoxy-1,2-dihydrophenyl)acetyl-CoA isomerase
LQKTVRFDNNLEEINMSTSTVSTVLYAEQGAVAIVTLNRPDALNSFTRQMHAELWAAFDKAEANESIRALVLTGAGRGFCAGADLAEFDFAPGPNIEDLMRRADPYGVIDQAFNPTARRLQALRMPTIAAINGVAAGAGASIAMSCDIAFASPKASFIQAFSKIGLVPDTGGSWFLPQRLGFARAMGLAMTGDKLSAAQAKEWGMIWEVVGENDDCVAAATAFAQRMAVMPTKALVATRRLLRDAQNNDLNEQLNLERDIQSQLGHTLDYIEGVTAFKEKRVAVFQGR